MKEFIAFRRLLHQLGALLDIETTTILCDNLQTVRIVNNQDHYVSTKLKHINIQQHWLRELLKTGATGINVQWVETDKMPADGLTKLLPEPKHAQFIRLLNLATR